MKIILQFMFLLLPLNFLHSAGLITNHVDIRFDYTSEGWVAFFQYGQSVEEPDFQAELDSKSLPLRDFAWGSPGDRFVQTNDASYAFLGVIEGSPFWLLPEATNDSTWPGFDNLQEFGTFLSYQPEDPRVDPEFEAPYWKVKLQSVEYSGQSPTTPHFSLWQTPSFEPTVWMATSDGIGPGDCYYTTEGVHSVAGHSKCTSVGHFKMHHFLWGKMSSD